MQGHRKLIFLVLLVFVILLAIGIGSWLGPAQAFPTQATKPHYRILYLVPPKNELQANEDTPGSFASLQAEGVQATSDFSTLKKEVATQPPDAIILHKNLLAQIDQKWVQQQYRKGVIVVAVNLTMRELAQYLDDSELSNGNWTEGWYKKPFYSYAGKKPATDAYSVQESARSGLFAGAISTGTNNFGANVKPFISTIRLSIQSLRQQ